MSDKIKLWLTGAVTVLSALVAAVAGLYPPEEVPEWARITTAVGGSLVAALGALGFRSKLVATKAKKK